MREAGTSRYIRGPCISVVPNYPASQQDWSMAHAGQLGASACLCRRLLRITTHGPGNRPCSSMIPRNAYFYALSAPCLPYHTMTINCQIDSQAYSSEEQLG